MTQRSTVLFVSLIVLYYLKGHYENNGILKPYSLKMVLLILNQQKIFKKVLVYERMIHFLNSNVIQKMSFRMKKLHSDCDHHFPIGDFAHHNVDYLLM